MKKPIVLVCAWLPDGLFAELAQLAPDFEWIDGRESVAFDAALPEATITYGLPPLARLGEATALKWIQLVSAGVPQDLCPLARERGLTVTNLAGLYGSTIAEHAFALLTFLTRGLYIARENQRNGVWDRSVMNRLFDLQGKSLALVGLGSIGSAIARLGRAFGMRVIACRRTGKASPFADRIYPLEQIKEMLAEADVVAVAAPLTAQTNGLLGAEAFRAMKKGTYLINVSRGPIVEEQALLDALRSGIVTGAGLDVFAVEPLASDHPFWTMPQVIISPHYSGESVNLSDQPARRFLRNLVAWSHGRELEGLVDLRWGY